MKRYIEKCLAGVDLTADESAKALDVIMTGAATDAQIAGLLVALRAKGESVTELVGFARTMREKAIPLTVDDPDAMDIVGTGGDCTGTFNISTAVSFVVAGAGITVAKHGNRSVSSKCGSADVLQALGVNTQLEPQRVEACINSVGIGFMFAPVFHPAMKFAAKTRSELGIRTIFNMLGPLTNPAGVKRHLLGAFSTSAAEKMANALKELGTTRGSVVHNEEGMDEVGLGKPTVTYNVENGQVSSRDIDANDFELTNVPLSAMLGGTPELNAEIILNILKGERGTKRDVILANASLALCIAGKSSNLKDGVRFAAESIDSGKALRALDDLRSFTNKQ